MESKKTTHPQDSAHHSKKPAHQKTAHPGVSQPGSAKGGNHEAQLKMVLEGPVDELSGTVLDVEMPFWPRNFFSVNSNGWRGRSGG
jgi:hypothetical protein